VAYCRKRDGLELEGRECDLEAGRRNDTPAPPAGAVEDAAWGREVGGIHTAEFLAGLAERVPLAGDARILRQLAAALATPAARQGGEADVTPEMIDRALAAYTASRGVTEGEDLTQADDMAAALEAALSARHAGAGEAVAWQYRDLRPGMPREWKPTTEAIYWSHLNGCTTGRKDVDWQVRALYTAPPAREGVPEVLAWFAAESKRRAAVAAYNDRVALVRAERERGEFPGPSVDPEYQAMTAAQREAAAAVRAMYDALAAAPTAGEGSKDGQ